MAKVKRYRIVQRKKKPKGPIIRFVGASLAVAILIAIVILRSGDDAGAPSAAAVTTQKPLDEEVPVVHGQSVDWVVSRYQTKKDMGGEMPPRPTLDQCERNKITFKVYTEAWDKV